MVLLINDLQIKLFLYAHSTSQPTAGMLASSRYNKCISINFLFFIIHILWIFSFSFSVNSNRLALALN